MTTNTKAKRGTRAMRGAVGMSRETLAARLGISVAWLGQIERHPEFMTPEMAERIAAVLGVTPDQLRGAF